MSQVNRPTSHIVSEIFTDFGTAFTLLGELEVYLNPDSDTNNKIAESDLLALRAAVNKFGEEIENMCQRIKERTLLQIRNSMKRHAYEEAGLPLRKQQILATSKTPISQEKARNASSVLSQSSAKSADITLNMLNATEQEVDVEGLATADKLDYGCTDGS
ncbi:chromatin complexes subunit BAP18-like [Argiope bruennichi]|uniref:Chromatin complexes subunit BAP18 like protein n=1 Tax=Argiope bruennichi TaxID=94029 RepID=A0A8T0EXR3_ARGBR|nr:chromatin complexes subunit BAP18-like [Argiope bruennichi]KAF8783156.1 Chromatin complexes subunit BAP18 like protein [Argiope bruennichi]